MMRTTLSSLMTIAFIAVTATTAKGQEPGAYSTGAVRCYNQGGTGANAMRVCFSDHGNIVKFESPAGSHQIGQFNTYRDGYAICTGNLPDEANVSHGYDTGGIEAGFGPPTVVDLTPLTIDRDTTNGVFRLRQVFKRDLIEKDVTIEMTVTNLSGVDRPFVKLQRAFEGDIDNNSTTNMWFGRSFDSAFAWIDQPAAGLPANGHGLMLTALTYVPANAHATAVNTIANYNPVGAGFRTGDACIVYAGGLATPVAGAHNLVGRVLYGLGTIPAGGSTKVVYKYTRF